MPQSWLLLTKKKEAKLKHYQSFCITKGTDKWETCFHTRHIQANQYSIEYICRVLNTLYDKQIYLQKEIGVDELDPSRPSLFEVLEQLSKTSLTEKISEQLERFNLRINQLEEINSRILKLETKLDYLKEKQYLADIEKKLVRTETIAKSIHQQAAGLEDTQESLKKLLETLISRIG